MLREKRVDVKALRKGAGRTALRPRYSVFDCSKLFAAGIQMRSWKEGLRAYLSTVK